MEFFYIFLGSNHVPSLFITWLRNVKLDFTNSHFSRLNLRFIFVNLMNTHWRCSKCSSQLVLQTFRSFINTFNNLSMCVLKTSIIVMENMLITFRIPKGMTVQSNNLDLVIRPTCISFLKLSWSTKIHIVNTVQKTIMIFQVGLKHFQLKPFYI